MWLLAAHLASSSHVLSDEQVNARSPGAAFSLASALEKTDSILPNSHLLAHVPGAGTPSPLRAPELMNINVCR